MKFSNKKYAIRKLSIGVASVAIGFLTMQGIAPESWGGGVTYALEASTNEVDTNKEWKPEGSIIAQGEDGVPWKLYENGYLLFNPETGKDTLSNNEGDSSWKKNYGQQIKAIGFSGKVYAPKDSTRLFAHNYFFDLKYIDASKIDTSNVTNMNSMFNGASSLTNLDVSHWNTSKVTDMSYMFYASGLTNLDVSNWDTSQVTTMYSMFAGTNSLTNLDVSRWNTSKVTTMHSIFTGASSLTNLDVSRWDTSKVTDMDGMFNGASSLTNLDVSRWDTSNVKQMRSIFSNVSSVTSLDVSGWNTNKVTDMMYMFYDTNKLKELKLGENLKNNTSYTKNLFQYLNAHSYGNVYTNRWIKADGSAGPFTIDEWNTAYRNDPVGMSGTWVREKVSTKYILNFNSGTSEQITSKEVEKDTQATLPTPTVDNIGYKFLGWSKSQDGEVITNTTNIANPNETITLYAKWEKVNNITKQRIPIEPTTVYQGDNTLDKGKRNEDVGQVGEKEIITTYKVTPITGELTEPTTTENIISPMRPKVIKVGTKPTEAEKQIDLLIKEIQSNTLVRGKEKITQGRPRVEKEITEYTVNEITGDITEFKRIEIIDEGTPTVKTIGTREPVNKIINEDGKELTPTELTDYTEPNYGNPDGATEEGDPIYNVRRITTTYKSDDTLEKGKQEVEKDGKSDGNKIVKVGTKPTVLVETIPSPVRYEKDDSREKGQENITVQGKDGSKTTTTTYTVNPKTGEVEEHPQEPVIIEPTTTIIKVALKDKIEIVNKTDGSVIKEITSYTVNEKTGEITETKTEEVIKNKVETSKGEDTPPTVDNNQEFTGGVNSIDTPVVENLPELKVAVIKDKENNLLDVIKENETPKPIQGYKNTGKTEVDKDGYKVYIYEKIEENSKGNELPPVVDNKDFVGGIIPNESPIVDALPELKVAVIKDKDNNILEVIKENEKPKDIPGYKNTGKTGIDNNGYKVYIYEKVEDKQESTVNSTEEKDTPQQEGKNKLSTKENNDNKDTINKKEELPKTSASLLSSLGLLAGFGLLKRKKD